MTTTTTRERFAVSADGLRQLHGARPPWTLVKELIQNAWDEAPRATRCDVRIRPGPEGTTEITVEDDGPGFADVSDAWTLMADTPKRANPEKRGRFNLGEKEIIAVAISAEIETAGTTVTFPPEGGRRTAPNDRKRGTAVRIVMPWTAKQAEELQAKLRRFRPTECRLTVEGEEVRQRTALATRHATLRTVVQPGPGLPIQDTRRKTRIDVLERTDAANGWIYEMGIPIQSTSLPYDVDIQQKVPMPPNRNTVAAGYLQDVMAETLNAMHERMAEDAFSENWVRTAIEDERIDEAAVRTVRRKRYGERAVLWSSDTDANMRAAEAGFQVVHPKAMSGRERKVLGERAGLESAKKKFGRPPERQKPDGTNDVRERFSSWVAEVGHVLDLAPTVKYVTAPDAGFIAQCTPSRRCPEVTINTSFCPDEWLAERGLEQIELLIHELAHALADTPMEHGPGWGEACASAGARIAEAVARKKLTYEPKPGATAGGRRLTTQTGDAAASAA